jgi:hypothetical protein
VLSVGAIPHAEEKTTAKGLSHRVLQHLAGMVMRLIRQRNLPLNNGSVWPANAHRSFCLGRNLVWSQFTMELKRR